AFQESERTALPVRPRKRSLRQRLSPGRSELHVVRREQAVLLQTAQGMPQNCLGKMEPTTQVRQHVGAWDVFGQCQGFEQQRGEAIERFERRSLHQGFDALKEEMA